MRAASTMLEPRTTRRHGTVCTAPRDGVHAVCRLAVDGQQQVLRGHPAHLLQAHVHTCGAVNYGLLLAGAVIAMIPCILVHVALQRYYVRGLVSGALKG